jgi:cell division protein FtsW (lipid II flippase)
MKELLTKRLFKTSLFLLIGGIGGFAYYYFIGCNTGTCPITGNPYISTSYGMLMGLIISFDSKKKQNREKD